MIQDREVNRLRNKATTLYNEGYGISSALLNEIARRREQMLERIQEKVKA